MVEREHIKPRSRGVRWVLITIVSLLVIVVGAGAVAVQQRLVLADWVIGEAARHFGFDEVRYKLSRLEIDGATVRDISLGPELRLGVVDVGYSLSRLMEGRIDRITVSDGDIDISTPDDGAIGKIRALSQSGADTRSPAPPLVLPDITVQNVKIHGTIDSATLAVEIDADLKPDLSGAFSLAGTASYRLPNRLMSVKNLTINGQLASGGTSGDLTLKNATLTDQSAVNWFPPLRVSGKGRYANSNVTFSILAADLKNRLSTTVVGDAELTARSATAKITIPNVSFSTDGLQPGDLSPLARLPIPVKGTISGSATLSWQNDRPAVKADIRLSGGGVTVDKSSLKGMQARITAQWPTADNRARIAVHVPHAVARHEGMPFRIRSTAATAMIDPATEKIQFSLPILQFSHMAATPLFAPLRLRGRGDLTGGRLGFNLSAFLDVPALSQNLVNVTGQHRLDDGSGRASVKIPELNFAPGVLEPADIASALALLQKVTGQVSGQSDLSWSPSGYSASGRLRLSDLALATDTLSVRGITTDLQLSSLLPPRTASPQTVKAARISSGVVLENPHITFSIADASKDAPPVVIIHKIAAEFIGGNISISELRADPEATTHRFTLDLDNLDLQQVFALVELEGVSGTGKLSGKIPLSITGDDVVISDGQLTSSAPGILRFRSAKARQALAGGGEQVDLLLRVLDDFHYNRLSLKIGRKSSGAAHLGLHLGGHNPAIKDGHAFNLNINLQGNVDRLLATVLEGYRLSDRAIRATVGAGQK